jgi:hypothetical protein
MYGYAGKLPRGPPMLFYICCVQHGYAEKLPRGPSCYSMYVVYSMGTLESCPGAPCYSMYVVYSMGTLESCTGAPHAILCMLCTAWVCWKVVQGPLMLFYVCCVQHGYAGKLPRGPSCYSMYVVYSMGTLESCPGAPHAILCMLCTPCFFNV